MDIKKLFLEIEGFNKITHGSSDYHKEIDFIKGDSPDFYAPYGYLKKKLNFLDDFKTLWVNGFTHSSFELFGNSNFKKWYENQFARKLLPRHSRQLSIIELPDKKSIFDVVEKVNHCYEQLREQNIILNGKNLPIQLGEWYAKAIFGLKQVKSTSQRGFDFFLDEKRIEVKIHWSDKSSPKGVKVRKSLLDLSEYCVIIYLAKNFMIREICFLDSQFVSRKFFTKGHTVFLKDVDLQQYFFSKSDKHKGKVVSGPTLLKYSSPMFAVNIAEKFQ